MDKKNTILLIAVIILFIIAGYLFFSNDEKTNSESSQTALANSGELNSNSIKLTREEYQEIIFDYVSKTVSIEYYVNNLDKEGCLQLETKLLQDDCVNAVELTQKALQENNPAICENRAYKISERLRAFCAKKVFLEGKNE